MVDGQFSKVGSLFRGPFLNKGAVLQYIGDLERDPNLENCPYTYFGTTLNL